MKYKEKNDDDAIFAWKRLKRDFSNEYNLTVSNLDYLLSLSKEIDSPLLKEIKPDIALLIKWKFDLLAKTGESPFAINHDIKYWISTLEMLKSLASHQWFDMGEQNVSEHPFVRTENAFNYMWPKTTQDEKFNMSAKMAKARLEQVYGFMEDKNYLKDSIILDSGCGPGRYIDALIKLNIKCKNIIGIDQGNDIIEANKERFGNYTNVKFYQGFCDSLPIDNSSIDFVISAGVLHHLKNSMRDLIKEHARVLKNGGYFFVFIVGRGGLFEKICEFLTYFLEGIPVEFMYQKFSNKISPLRLQGLLDRGFAKYQLIDRDEFEKILSGNFNDIVQIPGIRGLDITKEIYSDDMYFDYRFGTGNLRYLCRK